MNPSRILCIVSLTLCGMCAGLASSTYHYQGAVFTEASVPYQLGERITGALVLTAALPANMAPADIPRANVLGFDFNDGQQNRNFTNSTVCRLILGTDASGNINAWNIWMRQEIPSASDVRFSMETYSLPDFSGDLVGSAVFPSACGAGALQPRAASLVPGLWSLEGLYANGFEQ